MVILIMEVKLMIIFKQIQELIKVRLKIILMGYIKGHKVHLMVAVILKISEVI